MLVGLSLIAYLPVFQNGFIWDDDAYITENVHLQSTQGLRAIWLEWGATIDYYPLTFTTFWLEARCFGVESATPFHTTNVLLHAAGAVLLWLVLLRLRLSEGVAWVAAAIFAVHPVHVESVAWICERKNVLSAVLYFLTLLVFMRFYRFDEESPVASRRWPWLLLTIVLYVLSILAKTVTATLPLVLLVIIWWKLGRLTWRDLAVTLPMLAIGVPLCYPAMWTQKWIVWAQGPEFALTFAERFLIVGRVPWFYLSKLVWPAGLVFIYPKWDVRPAAWWQWLYPLATLALVIGCWAARYRVGRGPFAAVLMFGVTLAPAMGFFNIYWHRFTFVADHVQHLASVAMVTLLVSIAATLLRRLGERARPAGVLAAAAVLVVFTATSYSRCFAYENLAALWNDTIERNPSCWMAFGNRGLLAMHDGDRARADLRRAIDLNPRHYESLNNLGVLELSTREYARAMELFNRAIRANERYLPAYRNRGKTLVLLGRLDDAIECYRKALSLRMSWRSADVETQYLLAISLAKAGRIEESFDQFSEAMRRDKSDPLMIRAMGMMLAAEGRPGDAVLFLKRGLALMPEDAHALTKLAWILATSSDDRVRDGVGAVTFAERAREATKGHSPDAMDALAAAYAEVGRFEDAAAIARDAAGRLAAAVQRLPEGPQRVAYSNQARDMRLRAEQYAQGKAWREPAAK